MRLEHGRDVLGCECWKVALDLLSGGRFDFGIGAGWNAEEMENHGTEFDTHFKVMIDRALFQLKSESREALLPRLDELAKFIDDN